MRKTIYVLILSLMPTLAMAREQNSLVKLVNLSGKYIYGAAVGHKYANDRFAKELEISDIRDKTAKNIGHVTQVR